MQVEFPGMTYGGKEEMDMGLSIRSAGQGLRVPHQEGAARNERFVAECLKKIRAAPDAEEGLGRLLQYLGESLECDRVYVFEEIDRQHIHNTYEWCREGIPSGIEQLPYVPKKDLLPWYTQLTEGRNIIEPNVEHLCWSEPLLGAILQQQNIHSIILSPLLSQRKIIGLLGADNPPPEKMEHISVLFDVLSYFVSSLVSQRELKKLRDARDARQKPKPTVPPRHAGKTILLVDDSRELLKCNERVLRPDGYAIRSAGTIHEARKQLEQERPDAIVMDIDLPDGSGLDFCRKLRKDTDIPVVFLTARSDAQTAREGIAAGGCAFLTKPYQLEKLREAVGDAVEGERARKSVIDRSDCKKDEEGMR